jgi:AbrB family looped-hinge helix DNA binding protein
MESIAQVSGRGTVTLPADVRRALGLNAGDVLTVRIEDGRIVLTPAVVTPVEIYSEGRLREFAESAALSKEEIEAARSKWSLPRKRA